MMYLMHIGDILGIDGGVVIGKLMELICNSLTRLTDLSTVRWDDKRTYDWGAPPCRNGPWNPTDKKLNRNLCRKKGMANGCPAHLR